MRHLRVSRPPATQDRALNSWLEQLADAVNSLPSGMTFVTATSNYTVRFWQGVVYANPSSVMTIVLPSERTMEGAFYHIKNLSAHTVNISPFGQSINTQDTSYSLHFDGSNYELV